MTRLDCIAIGIPFDRANDVETITDVAWKHFNRPFPYTAIHAAWVEWCSGNWAAPHPENLQRFIAWASERREH